MKILVPTDFSPAAGNALEYAFNLAAETGGSVAVLNVYHVPLPAGEVPLMLISPHEILDRTNERLKELVSAAQIAFSDKFTVSSSTRQGFAAEEIATAAGEMNADLVVMGTQGATSSIAALLGSVTVEVMKKTQVPVLIIPLHAAFVPVKQIVFAYDYSTPCKQTSAWLSRYAKMFNAELSIVNVVTPDTKADLKAAEAGVMLDESLAATPHHLHFLSGADVLHELMRFIDEHKSDWLVVVPRARGFFQALFHRSIAGLAALRIGIPVLSIHEQ